MERPPSCAGGEARPALFYRATIPSGQRLTVRATPTAGDRTWAAVLQAFSACQSGMCLASNRAALQSDGALRYVNNGAASESVLIGVSASGEVSGATFRLDVSIRRAGAKPDLPDGPAAVRRADLRNQDLSEGQVSQVSDGCKPPGGPSLFYSATLLEQQSLFLQVLPRDGSGRGAPLFVQIHDGCGRSGQCSGPGQQQVSYTNTGPGTKTIVIEVATFIGPVAPIFDLMVSMPLPTGAFMVRAADTLVTTEAGGSATFDVVLASPPLLP